MSPTIKSAFASWQRAEVEANDTYALLRVAFLKYLEGIGPRPDNALMERSMHARLRMLASMQVVMEFHDASGGGDSGLAPLP